MSAGGLERVEVMGRVANAELKVTDAAAMLQLSYRQVKRLWGRYQRLGRKRAAAWQCGSSLQSHQTRKVSAPGHEFDQAPMFGFRG